MPRTSGRCPASPPLYKASPRSHQSIILTSYLRGDNNNSAVNCRILPSFARIKKLLGSFTYFTRRDIKQSYGTTRRTRASPRRLDNDDAQIVTRHRSRPATTSKYSDTYVISISMSYVVKLKYVSFEYNMLRCDQLGDSVSFSICAIFAAQTASAVIC